MVGQARLASAGFHRVDGDDGTREGPEGADHGNHPGEFGFFIHRRGPGPGGFAANINDGGPVCGHLHTALNRVLNLVEPTSIGKGIGRDIENAHDGTLGGEVEGAMSKLPDHGECSVPGRGR